MVAEREDAAAEGMAIDCPILVTERLVLRPPHQDDVAELAEFANNRRIAEMLARMPHPYGEAEARAFVAASGKRPKAGAVCAVTNAGSGAFLGCAGLDANESGLDLGYWIGQPHWGKGYATETAHALVDLAFRATDVAALSASCR